jgi:hypothetical protein
MIDADLSHVIAQIHASGRQMVLEFTGAGSLGLAWLHSVPGSSRTILEATDRYSAASLAELLGKSPSKSVDPQTAIEMAGRAYLRACRLGDDDRLRLGVACTATIATDYAKRGEHRCCVAVQDNKSVTTHDLVLAKGKRNRDAEEMIVAKMLINAIAEAAEIGPVPFLLSEGEVVATDSAAAIDPLESLWSQTARWVVIGPNGARALETPVTGCVYSGSFNPFHFGHEALAAAAERATGLPVTFEIPAINADKAPLQRGELERRLAQFRGRRVAVTRAPLFSDKACLFPGCIFVVGYDTAVRLLDNRFYGGSDEARDQSLSALRAAGCRVLVAGRLDGAEFRTMRHLTICANVQDLFLELPESAFRADVSGTALRAAERCAILQSGETSAGSE